MSCPAQHAASAPSQARPTCPCARPPPAAPTCRRTPVASLAGVQALLDAGALLVGKTTLHEIGARLNSVLAGCLRGPTPCYALPSVGAPPHHCEPSLTCPLRPCPRTGLGTTGLNLATGTARNAHSPAHHTGGSSSGSAAAVAAGLCPFAVGAFSRAGLQEIWLHIFSSSAAQQSSRPSTAAASHTRPVSLQALTAAAACASRLRPAAWWGSSPRMSAWGRRW